MSTIMWVLLLAPIVYIAWSLLAGFSKYKAALNALNAKYTLVKLTSEQRNEVVSRARRIILEGGARTLSENPESLPERELYGFYALAMAELGIPPALDGYEWHYTKNPFIALVRADAEIEAARHQIRKSHDIEVSLTS